MKKLPPETLNDRIARLSPFFRVVKPAGKGPFPTIIMLHGCGRADIPMPIYAEGLAKIGVASIIVDSFGPRDIGMVEAAAMVCTGVILRAKERTGDLVSAIEWAKQQSWADSNRIGAAGWSHGGWAIMDGLALEDEIGNISGIKDLSSTPLNDLKLCFMIYPWCGPGSYSMSNGWQRKIPAHAIICGEDIVVGDFLPKKTVEHLKKTGIDIDYTYFENATHSYDEQKSLHPAQKYSKEYTDQAIELLGDFCTKHFKVPEEQK